MKYVMFFVEGELINQAIPVIFPNVLVHEDVAEAVKTMPGMQNAKPISAGEVTFNPVDCAHCDGRSDTLDLASRGERDSRIINLNDYGAGLS